MSTAWRPSQQSLWPRGSRTRGSDRVQSGARNSTGIASANLNPDGELIHTFHAGKPESIIAETMKLGIDKSEYIASYNWLDSKASTILVPGSPPRWTPSSRSTKLEEDGGIYYRDPNAARYPTYPMEPAVRALLRVKPDFDSSGVDVVGCGNTLGSLLSACRLKDERTFTFGVERVGNTIFLVRQTSPKEVIENVRGYGHSFPESYTTWPRDVKGSASHQRLVQYDFAGLRCVIRSECDGYLPYKVPPANDLKGIIADKTSLEEATDSLSMSHPIKRTESRLSVHSAGQTVPQEAIFDLKTRSIRRDVNIEEFLPRLWVNQTPNFIFARHESGVFKPTDTDVLNVQPEIQSWQSTNREVLLRLQSVLRKLTEITSQEGMSRVQVHRMGTGPLQVKRPTKEWTVLPSGLKTRWERKELRDWERIENEVLDESDSEDENEGYLKF